jgi:glycolate oxidase FAD binding subunit
MDESVFRRPGTPADAVDGVTPGEVAEPATPEALAQVLADASARGLATVVRGGGSKLSWGRVPARIDLVLSTSRLRDTLIHRDGDLTATVSAGVRLADLNARLAEKGQWLPVESAFEATTVGGLVATNDAGPLRHRFGTPRDLLIGVTLALADGRLVKSGGVVVKNVAGYDLGRFVSGSLGTMAVVVDATFKLAPVLRSSITLRIPCGDAGAMAEACRTLASSQVEPSALDVRVTAAADAVARELLVLFASSPAATEAQAQALHALVPRAERVTPDDEARLWIGQVELPWRGDRPEGGAVVRCSWLPSDLPAVVRQLDACRARGPIPVFVGRAAVGAGLVRVGGTLAEQKAVIEELRRGPGRVAVLSASPGLKGEVDVWGDPVPWAVPLAALKRSFDPAGILGAGRGPT